MTYVELHSSLISAMVCFLVLNYVEVDWYLSVKYDIIHHISFPDNKAWIKHVQTYTTIEGFRDIKWLVVFQMQYLMCLAANYAHIRDHEKLQEIQELQYLADPDNLAGSKDRF